MQSADYWLLKRKLYIVFKIVGRFDSIVRIDRTVRGR